MELETVGQGIAQGNYASNHECRHRGRSVLACHNQAKLHPKLLSSVYTHLAVVVLARELDTMASDRPGVQDKILRESMLDYWFGHRTDV